MIFCKKKFRHNFDFTLQGQVLEIVDTYSFLGVIFKYNGTFSETKKQHVLYFKHILLSNKYRQWIRHKL